MKRRVAAGAVVAAGSSLLAAGSAKGQCVNFHCASNGAVSLPGVFYNALYYGQGAYVDPGNNVWNGFGSNPGPGSTYFYGQANPNSNSNTSAVPANNPGNPYAWYAPTSSTSGTSSTGKTLFSPTNYSAPAGSIGNADSSGKLSSVQLSMSYTGGAFGGENGGTTISNEGSPSFLLSTAAVTTSAPGTFTLSGVAPGTYNLYLYSENFDGDRGATFTVSSGTALNGITTAMNANQGTLNSFILGVNYVEFLNVTPNLVGQITGTWDAVINGGNSGEGDFNGLQLVATPEPATLGLLAAGVAPLLVRRRHRRRRATIA